MAISSIGGATQAPAPAASTKVSTSDPRDLNKDGKVTQAEIEAYNLMHGNAGTSTTKATTSPAATSGTSMLDTYA
jgi:hypothetical protein